MSLSICSECTGQVSDKAISCPHCGNPINPVQYNKSGKIRFSYEWKSKSDFLGFPLVHVAVGRNKKTGRLMVAKGIIAIGQFGIGLITIAQFGIGFLFGFGQFVAGLLAIGQFALGIYFGLGQFATGMIVIGQFAIGKYVLAQTGLGEHIWSTKIRDPIAIEYFRNIFK